MDDATSAADHDLHERITAAARASEVAAVAWSCVVGEIGDAGAIGLLDPDDPSSLPLSTDAIFRIASVSKPILAAATLQAVDAGQLRLDDPIEQWLPELADRQVLTDSEGDLDQPLVPAVRPLTVADLLTFRCGWGMDFQDPAPPHLERLWEWGIGPGPTAPAMSPEEFLTRLGRLPLQEQPGTRWRYHVGYDVLSVLLERVHAASLAEVLQEGLFTPLGMTDTGFSVSAEQRKRLGASRFPNDTGQMRTWDDRDGLWASPPPFRSGSAGLVSTVADLQAFAAMLLRDGAGADGHRVLSAAAVARMTSDALTAEQRARARIDEVGDAVGWGMGLAVRHRSAPGASWPGPGVCWWDGGLGSRLLIDPARRLSVVVLSTDGFGAPGMPQVLDDITAQLAPQS